MPRVQHDQSVLPDFAKHLGTFGEAGTMKTGKECKVGTRGVIMMFFGHAKDHAGDCMRMFNPLTRKVSEIRDLTWLRRMYCERPNAEVTMKDPVVVLELIQDDAPAEVADGADGPQDQGGMKTVQWVDKFDQVADREESVRTKSSDHVL